MTIIDDELLPEIKALADEIGKDVDVDVEVFNYAASTGTGTPTPTPYTGQKLLGVGLVTSEDIAAGLAQDGDTRGIFAAQGLAFVPTKNETKVTWAGVAWVVKRVENIEPAESVLAYKVFLKRA